MAQKVQDPSLWDIRVRERNLRKGTLSQAEVEKFLGALPDREADAQILTIDATPPERPQASRSAPPSVVLSAHGAPSASMRAAHGADEESFDDDDGDDEKVDGGSNGVGGMDADGLAPATDP